ncbi:protein MRG1-like [Apium graveolens]|uniref:protein MRG1-like n=1 Tax=Apium graveolens TaxID=4045 RepID=UPI003D799B39
MGRSNSGVSGDSLTNSLYLEGEKVLAFYGGKWYPAKVRKVEYEKQIEAWTYWVHYIGWNKRYDEWILDAQLLKKFSEECSQKHLGKRGRSAMEDPLIMEENKLSIEIPQALKTQLLNDREYVTNSSKLVDIFFKQRCGAGEFRIKLIIYISCKPLLALTRLGIL